MNKNSVLTAFFTWTMYTSVVSMEHLSMLWSPDASPERGQVVDEVGAEGTDWNTNALDQER